MLVALVLVAPVVEVIVIVMAVAIDVGPIQNKQALSQGVS